MAELSDAPAGVAYLRTIGYVYKQQSRLIRGLQWGLFGIPGSLMRLRQRGHILRTELEAWPFTDPETGPEP